MNLVNQSIIKHKVGLLNLAEELKNVSQACRIMGVSRDTFSLLSQHYSNKISWLALPSWFGSSSASVSS